MKPLRLLRLLQTPLVLALFALLLWRTDLSEIRSAFADMNPATAFAVVALNAPIALLFGVRSHFVLRQMGHDVDARVVIPASIVGNVAGALTPASSGEILRAAALRSHAQVSVDDGATLVLFERVYSFYLLVLATVAVLAFVSLSPMMAGASSAACAVAALLPVGLGGRVRITGDGRTDARGRMRAVSGRVASLFGSTRLALRWVPLTFAIFAITGLQYWLLAQAVSGVISGEEAWIALGVSQIAGIVSLIPLSLGASDGSLAALLDRFGMTLEQGTAVAVLVRAASTIPLILVAVVAYVYLQRRGDARDAVVATATLDPS